MPALFAILRALRRAVARDLAAIGSIKVNNLFLFVALLAYGALNTGQPPKSAYPFFLLLGFLLLFPLSSDPLAVIPASRLSLWPLSPAQRIGLRLASLLLSPIPWIGALILLRTARLPLALAFCALAVAIQLAMALARRASRRNIHFSLLRDIPQFPGPLGGLIRKNLRQMLSLLDPYAALALAVGGIAYRFLAPHPDPAAPAIVSLLIALTLSTYAQSLFGLELASAGSGMTRYRLLPLSGWQILLAKDAAFLALLLILVFGLDPGPGLTFGLAALALGHHSSVLLDIPQQRWRFTGGRLLPVGAIQALGGMALGFLEHQQGLPVLLFATILYVISLAYYGHRWDRKIVTTI